MPPEPRSRPLEGIRFYVDEDILGIGYALMWLRADVTSWEKVGMLTRHWTAIENMIEREPVGPWWLSVSASGVNPQSYRS